MGRLEFLPPDPARFPCLALAYRAARSADTLPVVLNAANEVAVEAFLGGRIGFMGIPHVIEHTMNAHVEEHISSFEVVRRVDEWARAHAWHIARRLESV